MVIPVVLYQFPGGEWLRRMLAEEESEALRGATRTGQPCGSEAFVRELEGQLARPLAPQKRGPKPRPAHAEEIPGPFDKQGGFSCPVW